MLLTSTILGVAAGLLLGTVIGALLTMFSIYKELNNLTKKGSLNLGQPIITNPNLLPIDHYLKQQDQQSRLKTLEELSQKARDMGY